MSLMDDFEELGLRLEYHDFLNDPKSPLWEFEEWKERRLRPVPTNPATTSLLDQISAENIRASLSTPDKQ